MCLKQKNPDQQGLIVSIGAGNEIRTRDLNLGKVALYQLSYSRSASKQVAILAMRAALSS